jgi:hypothetical protein
MRVLVFPAPVPTTESRTVAATDSVCVRPARRRSEDASDKLDNSRASPSKELSGKSVYRWWLCDKLTVHGVSAIPVPGDGTSRHVARQVREALRAKAGLLLLRAAETGAVFMLPKLLDTGNCGLVWSLPSVIAFVLKPRFAGAAIGCVVCEPGFYPHG